MNLNIIITTDDTTREHVPHLINLIKNYKVIKPEVVLVYCGEDTTFLCNVRIKAKPYIQEFGMTMAGVNYFKNTENKNKKFLKLSAYVWPLDENKIIEIFDKLDTLKKPYAGNFWHNNLEGSLSADFFCLDLACGNILENVTDITNDSEVTLNTLLRKRNKSPYIIPERNPVLYNNYFRCDGLRLTACKHLEENLKYLMEIVKKTEEVIP
jgi:hypothetical protein